MLKRILLLGIGCISLVSQAIAQDGNFNNLNFNELTKGGGGTNIFGWGLNANPTLDVRPNQANGQAFVFNHHTGLTFSAHSNYGGIRFYNQGYPGPLDPSTGATMVMSIQNNAVGIGTTNPRVPLDVGGDLSNQKLGSVLGRLPEGDATGEGTFLGVRGYNTNQVGGKSFALEHSFYGQTNSSIAFHRGESITGGFMTFSTNNNEEKMRIDANGNVGIGTTTPNTKLAVNGNIRAKEVKVEATNWPDYVFEDNYKSLSLSELENYIKTNKHLPEIPEAKTLEQNGIAVGDMIKMQQKKIEELTLHLIQKDKELVKEREINKEQEGRISLVENKYEELKQMIIKMNK